MALPWFRWFSHMFTSFVRDLPIFFLYLPRIFPWFLGNFPVVSTERGLATKMCWDLWGLRIGWWRWWAPCCFLSFFSDPGNLNLWRREVTWEACENMWKF
jgi:hypothetical protein